MVLNIFCFRSKGSDVPKVQKCITDDYKPTSICNKVTVMLQYFHAAFCGILFHVFGIPYLILWGYLILCIWDTTRQHFVVSDFIYVFWDHI